MEEKENKENNELVLFENSKIRRQMYNGEWNYSIVDVIAILTDSKRAKKYWSDLKKRLKNEGFDETSEKIGQLKMMASDGKMRKTDCANRETIFRLIQDEISKGTFDITTQQHKDLKGLDKQNLRDNSIYLKDILQI